MTKGHEFKENEVAVMTWHQLELIKREGRGSGWGMHYRPWLWIRRRNPSPVSNQVAGAMLPGLNRECCFLARVEWLIALLCFWLGAIDVREQFPLWPWPHKHPLRLLPGSERCDHLSDSRGLASIAKDAGIDHGYFVGSNRVPYVATTDIVATVPGSDYLRLAAIPVKAHKKLLEAEPADRMLERLELERRYHLALGNHVTIKSEEIVPDPLAGNLVWFSSGARLPSHLDDPSQIVDFARTLAEAALAETLERGIAFAAANMGYPANDASLLFRYCVWHRLIDLDISRDVELSYPPCFGANRLAVHLRNNLFGETK